MKKVLLKKAIPLLFLFSIYNFPIVNSATAQEFSDSKDSSFIEPEIFELPTQIEKASKEELITQPFPPDEKEAEPKVNETVSETDSTNANSSSITVISEPSNNSSDSNEIIEENTNNSSNELIEIENDNFEELEEVSENILPIPPTPSRSVTIKRNQFLDLLE